MNFLWDVPFFRSQEGVLGRVLGGWQVNGLYFLSSGQRFTPTQVFNFAASERRKLFDNTFASGFIGLDNSARSGATRTPRAIRSASTRSMRRSYSAQT